MRVTRAAWLFPGLVARGWMCFLREGTQDMRCSEEQSRAIIMCRCGWPWCRVLQKGAQTRNNVPFLCSCFVDRRRIIIPVASFHESKMN
jgi:hypothetical protein